MTLDVVSYAAAQRAQAAAALRPRGNSIGYLGDSITAGSLAAYSYGDAFPLYAGVYSQQKLVPAGFYGVSGERTDQMWARIETALAKRPTYLCVLGGTNDIGQGITGISGIDLGSGVGVAGTDNQIVAWIAANLTKICVRAKAVGSIPVICTIPPNNSTAQRQRLILKANIWIRRYAILNGLPLVDFYTLLVKDGISATPAGNYKDAYASDGTHPNAAGAGAMGKLVSDTLTAATPPGPMPPFAVDRADVAQAVWQGANPLFNANTSNPGVRPDSWSNFGALFTDTNTVYTLVTDANVPGKMQQIALATTATTTGGITYGTATGKFATGDIIAICGYFTTDGVHPCQVQLVLNGTTYKPLNVIAGAAITRGVYYMEVPAPTAGTGVITTNLLTGRTAGVAGTIAFGFPAVMNLTQIIGETTAMQPN